MARLKRNNSSWHAHGLYLKYKQPTANEQPAKNKSKKNTNRWCRGKVGKEHEWHSFQRKRWDDERWDFVWSYTEIKCVVCRKEKYIKTAKATIYPFHIWVDKPNTGYQSVQVRVNGKILPIPEYQYHADKYWCKECYSWHRT